MRQSCSRHIYHSPFTDAANWQTLNLLTNACKTRLGPRILFGYATDKPTLRSIQKHTWDDLADGKHDAENIGRNTHRKEDNIRSKCQVIYVVRQCTDKNGTS